MSKDRYRNKSRSARKPKTPGFNAMAEAFKEAGIERSPMPAEKKPQTKNKPRKKSVNKNRNKTENGGLLKKAYKGVNPLKKKGRRIIHQSPRDLEKVYGTKKRSGQRMVSHVTKNPGQSVSDGIHETNARLRISSDSRLNEVLVAMDQSDVKLSWPVADQYPVSGDQEVELVLGLDFGTTYCKAVVQEPDSGRAWAVPFVEQGQSMYLLQSRLWKDGESFNLAGNGVPVGNLKVPLLDREMPAGHAISVVSFLTLVIRYVKAWFYENKLSELGGAVPFWSANIGLPAANLEDEQMVKTFKMMLWSALLLAEKAGNNVEAAEVGQCFASVNEGMGKGRSEITLGAGIKVHIDQIGVYPEIAAQIYGYLKSDKWDKKQNMFMLVDVGGGTVDSSVFLVEDDGEEIEEIKFLSTGVQNLGVYRLHIERLKWHIDQLKGNDEAKKLLIRIQKILASEYVPKEVPDDIRTYIQSAIYPEQTIDEEFYRDFRDLLWDKTIMNLRDENGWINQKMEHLPYLLCGGGRYIGLYQQFANCINSPNSSTKVRLAEIPMYKPEKLIGDGLGNTEYQRLSVAYGLSFYYIGKMITRDELAPSTQSSRQIDYKENYIGPEMM